MTDPETPQAAPPDDPPPEDATFDDTHAPPPPPLPPRRLTRRSHDRVICGVASGLGDFFNVDPAIFRLGFIALTFFGGSGLVLYVLGWLFLPDRMTGRSLGEDLLRRVSTERSPMRWIVLAIVAIVVINVASASDGGVFWAIVLIALGVLIFRRDESSTSTDDADPPRMSTSPMTAAPPTVTPTTPSPAATPPLAEPTTIFDDWRPTPITEPPEPPPPPSVLGRITVAAALILGGLVALIQNVTSLDVSVDQYAAMGLVVVGAGLLVGSRLGRSHGLIVLGVILALVMAAAATVPSVTVPANTGQRRFTPTSVTELRDLYELGAGDLHLDLSELDLERGQQVSVDASVGLGQLVVDVPPDTTIDVTARSEAGEIDAFDRQFDGTNVTLDHVERGPEGSPTIALDLSVGVGVIEVHQPSTAAPPSEGATTDTTVEPSEAA